MGSRTRGSGFGESGESGEASDGHSPDIAAPVVHVLGVLHRTRTGLEARLVEAAMVLSAGVGRALLDEAGVVSMEELSKGERRSWRAQTKKLAVAEVMGVLGVGMAEAQDLMGIACAPEMLQRVLVDALDAGWACWGQVRSFWSRCGRLPLDQVVLVAQAMFGTEAGLAAKERLSPEGGVVDAPWPAALFRDALEREATRVEGQDVAAERERRRLAYAARRAYVSTGIDGVATLMLTGDVVSVCAVYARIEKVARRLRHAGDERNLDQLRSDISMAVLLHGTLSMPEGEPEAWSEAQVNRFVQVLNSQPPTAVEVVIPWDALAAAPVCPNCHASMSGRNGADHDSADHDGADHGGSDRGGSDHEATVPEAIGPQATVKGVSTGGAPTGGVLGGGSVGQIVGPFSAFITPGHARELALRAGTVFHRLLTQPADGRLIERSRKPHAADADMRRQLLAADRYSRAPGSRLSAQFCELDHVIPWANHADCAEGTPLADGLPLTDSQDRGHAGLVNGGDKRHDPVRCPDPICGAGLTSELNLAFTNKRVHQFKTEGRWVCEINERRDVRWTTLLGVEHATRVHDYNQYVSLPALAGRGSDLSAAGDELAGPLLQALRHRGPGGLLADEDDYPGAADHGGVMGSWMHIRACLRKRTDKSTADTGTADTGAAGRGAAAGSTVEGTVLPTGPDEEIGRAHV